MKPYEHTKTDNPPLPYAWERAPGVHQTGG